MTLIRSRFNIFVPLMSRYLLLLLVSTALFSCETKEVKIQQLLLKGNLALEDAQLEQATYYYKEAIKLDSCFADAWNNLGTIAFRRGNKDEAIVNYDQAIQCRPTPSFYLNRANAHFENLSFFSALKDIEAFEKEVADSIPALVLKGQILARLKRYDEAKATFTTILSKDSLNPDHWVNRGTLFYYTKEFDKATPDLMKAIELDSANGEAFNALAMIQVESGSLKEAMRLVEQALFFEPGHAHFINNRGYIKILLGNLVDGETDINDSMVREPDNPWVYRNKGLIYYKLNEFESAERLFRQVLSMDSSVDKTAEYLGVTLIAAGKKAEGCQWLIKSQASELLKSNRCP